MFLFRSWSPAARALPLLLFFLPACRTAHERIEAPESRDDFGQPLDTRPITEDTVSETQMLHRRVQFDLRGGVMVPTGFFAENDFEPGPHFGGKALIEMKKNFFLGVAFDWARLEQGKGIPDDPAELADTNPDQFYDEIDRFSVLGEGEYDWTLARNFLGERTPLLFRLGVGAGATIVDGDPDPALGPNVEMVTFVGFLFRLSGGLRWQFHPNMLVFTEAAWDLVLPNTVEIRRNRERADLDGDIDFGSINIGAGIAFEF